MSIGLPDKKEIIVKGFFSIMFSALFIVLSKIKLTPIFGTETQFSAVAFFGPTLSSLLGFKIGILTIFLGQIFGIFAGLYQTKSLINLLTFFPVLFSGIYLSKNLEGNKKLVLVPLACITAFILHPIGRKVWFYSLFWLIPVLITSLRDKIEDLIGNPIPKTYTYSLASTFVGHAVGSITYLYLMEIPAKFWIQSIPMVPVERLIMAGGITFTYLAIKKSIKTIKEIAIPQLEEVPVKFKEKEKAKAKNP